MGFQIIWSVILLAFVVVACCLILEDHLNINWTRKAREIIQIIGGFAIIIEISSLIALILNFIWN